MTRDPNATERLRRLVAQITNLTDSGELHWEKQVGSAHRYARWNNNLLILGPSEALNNPKVPRYLFVTPFDSPACVEINSDDEELGDALMKLVASVENATQSEPPTDPFDVSEDLISRLSS